MLELCSKNSRGKKPSARRVNDWATKLPDAFHLLLDSSLHLPCFVNRGSKNEIDLSFELFENIWKKVSLWTVFSTRIRDERQRGFFCGCSFVFVNHHRHEKIYLFFFFAKFVIWMDIKCAFRNATILSSVRRYYESNFRFNKVGYELVARVPLAVRGTIKSRSKQCNFDSNCKLAWTGYFRIGKRFLSVKIRWKNDTIEWDTLYRDWIG